MRTLLISLVLLAGCSDDKPSVTVDAAVVIDAAIDAPAVTLTCDSYCTAIQTNCTGVNAQFGGTDANDAKAHCLASCAKFPVGTAADQSGATLGCHLYHAGMAMGAPTVHCIHAGPAGNQTDAAAGVCGDACTNFCAIQIGACGTAQYADNAACLAACGGFDKTHKYIVDATAALTVNPKGDSLACRLYHATNAAISAAAATTHCPHTAATPTGPCAGAATP